MTLGPSSEKTSPTLGVITLALCSFVSSCSREETPPSPADSNSVSVEAQAVRGKLDKMSDAERRQFVSDKLDIALNYIAQEPLLGNFLDSIFQQQEPRASFELVSDIPHLAEVVGFQGFQGDAFTISAETIKKTTQEWSFRHIINLAPECFATDGKLIVVVMHELLHMKRREDGVPFTTPTVEEQETFRQSISLSKSLAEALSQKSGKDSAGQMANRISEEIEEALIKDRILLSSWLRKPR